MALTIKFSDKMMLENFHASHKSGNPLALVEALAFCQRKAICLPSWLADELEARAVRPFQAQPPSIKKKMPNGETWLANWKFSVRTHAIDGVKKWQEDHSKYKLMPRKSVVAWLNKELAKFASSEDRTLKIVERALLGTKATCGIEVLRQIQFKTLGDPRMLKFEYAESVFGLWGPNNQKPIFGIDRELEEQVQLHLSATRN